MHAVPFVAIALFVLVRLNGDYRRRSKVHEEYKAWCDRAAMREESMHPWVSEEWRVSEMAE
jgi:hypothetical protein